MKLAFSVFVALSLIGTGALAFGAKAESVWVTRPDGGKQCEGATGQTLEAGAKDLQDAKIPILEQSKKNDGKLHIQMCGAPTGKNNSYRIPKAMLPQATALGFKELAGSSTK